MAVDKEHKKFSVTGDILGGQFLAKKELSKQWFFILYIFVLVLIYISINLGVEKTQLSQRRNQRELKNLKADYTSKAAKMQYYSKRGEIEIRLIEQGSLLEKPKQPPRVIEISK